MKLSASPKLTVILPAYNEEHRLQETVVTCQAHLKTAQMNCEILIVNDGSTDGTVKILQELENTQSAAFPISWISLSENQGKGEALWRGIQETERRLCEESNVTESVVLVADADGSANLGTSLEPMMQTLTLLVRQNYSKPAIVVGKRIEASNRRKITRWGFAFVVQSVFPELAGVDTQCGCKLMTVAAAILLYQDLHLKRWTHDVEVLWRARLRNIPVGESPMQWQDKEGSKLLQEPGGTVGISIVMLWQVLKLKWMYALGIWQNDR